MFDNDIFLNQSSTSFAPFNQLGSSTASKFDLNSTSSNVNLAPGSNLSSTTSNLFSNQQNSLTGPGNLPLYHRFTSAPGGVTPSSNFFQSQQPISPFRNSSATPLGFTESEFPSLGNNRGSAGFGGFQPLFRNVGFGRAGYANLIKQQTNAERVQPEFQIENEDFPALPKAQNGAGGSIAGKRSDSPVSLAGSESSKIDRLSAGDGRAQTAATSGIQTHSDGTVTGIPPGMLNDQFGMAGLLTFIRAIATEPGIVSLGLGQDLTKLGINLSAPEKNLYQTFGGPWSEGPCRPQDIDCQVPPEYLTNSIIGETLAPIKLNRYGEDLLFFLFYNFGGEVFQLAAAAELYNRDWRYHKEERVWLTRAPGFPPTERTETFEKGTYHIFDPGNWKKIQKEMTLEYSKLEDRAMLPPQKPTMPQQGQSMPQQPISQQPLPPAGGNVNLANMFNLHGTMHNS